ncbi:MAG: FAD-dependent oxidoreductase, partial [Opitutaceae bacterium]|nr:FAD-dependent oxidoreductase [Opitutaceae bacterium]
MKSHLALAALLLLRGEPLPADEPARADVLVYGATASGIVAAAQTARMGRTVLLLEPGRFIGGMTAGGLGATDTGSPLTIGGVAREFYRAIYNHYQRPEAWTRGETRADYAPKHRLAISERLKAHWFFEPSVALAHLRKLIDNPRVTLVTNAPLDRSPSGVQKHGATLLEIATTDGSRFAARRFIDATYEGDLMAAAGASFIIGREPNSRYRETLNGIRFLPAARARHVSPFVIPGDPQSGLLPGILPKAPGAEGDGDGLTQAYNFRLCLTDAPDNRRPFEKPDGYDPSRYELVLRHLLHHPAMRPGNAYADGLFTLTPMPNRKTDSNNKNLFSTDCVGRSWNWPAASYAEREKLLADHRLHTQGLLWFLANDPRVPEPVRDAVSRWGLARDEFAGNDNWPTQLYVREARRLIGEYVVTEHDCAGKRLVSDPVALASYSMDSHLVSLFVDETGTLRLEGGFYKRVAPYPVAYRALLPKRDECDNLLVPVCLSA